MTEEEKKAINDLDKFADVVTVILPDYSTKIPEYCIDEQTWLALKKALNLIQKQDTEINKLKNVIEEYEKECRQFKAFCRKIRRDDKHDVDEFNQGQEQKCNQFLNLLAGEKHWTYEGKYFDETDKQIEKMKENK